MKKASFIVALIALSTMATAQNTIYRQNLSKEINVLNVFGDCTIILKLDTCNLLATSFKPLLQPTARPSLWAPQPVGLIILPLSSSI